MQSKTYDYIIVGASPSGCMLAKEILQREKDSSICIIEAGELITTRWAACDPFDQRNLSFLLTFLSGIYLHELATSKKVPKHIWSCVGKGVGGGSAINGMVWARPTEEDLEAMLGAGFSMYAHQIKDIEAMMGIDSDGNFRTGTLVDSQWMHFLSNAGYPYENYSSEKLTASVLNRKCLTRTLSACKSNRTRVAGTLSH